MPLGLVRIDAGKYKDSRTKYELYPEKEKTWDTSIVKNQNRDMNKIVPVHLKTYVHFTYCASTNVRSGIAA